MTPARRGAAWIGVLAAMLAGPAGAQQRDPLAPLPGARAPTPVVQPPRAPAANSAALRAEVLRLQRGFDGASGISIIPLDDGWTVESNAARLFPQQSVSKLWVAITAMDALDRGRVSLDDRVTVGREDLTLFHQPLRNKVLGGTVTTTVGALLFDAITESDNTANDKLMRVVGGPDAVRDTIVKKGLGAIRFYNGERSLQSKIAGLTWSQSYSIGDAFYKARSALPMSLRKASFERYIADPYDGASAHAIAMALARLKRGELLTPASTQRLLSTMGRTRTGALRVRAGLAPGWSWNHKTGTGQELGGRTAGINDIGLLTAPDGKVYAMAIMTIPNKPGGAAQNLMRDVTRAIIAAHGGR